MLDRLYSEGMKSNQIVHNTEVRSLINKNITIYPSIRGWGFIYGLALTLLIAIAAKLIATLPFFKSWGSWS